MYNKTEFDVHYKSADLTIGTIYLICFAFGLPSNILALCFFVKQRLRSSELNNHLYILTTVNDAFISLLTLNYGMTMVRYRDVWLPDFCPTQHILFQMSQRISVLLVATLSFSRTYILLFPLRKVSQRLVLSLIAVVVVSMACFFAIPPFVKLVQITYHWEDGYCWAKAIPGKNMTKVWDEIDSTLDTIFLACPVLPVTVSCIIASYKILSSRKDKPGLTKLAKQSRAAVKKKRNQITLTIILVTLLYIVSNIPLFVNYILYLITIYRYKYPGPFYSSPVMYFYAWNFTALLSTSLNASANPIVYWMRFGNFREWIKGGCRSKPTTPSPLKTADLCNFKSTTQQSRNDLRDQTKSVTIKSNKTSSDV